MKKSVIAILSLVAFFFCASTVKAQENQNKESKKEIKVKKYTVMEQYEPDMVISAEDRIKLKKERIAMIKKRREIIDTLDISDRKRRKLLRELRSPFSDKWEKVIADIEFDDGGH